MNESLILKHSSSILGVDVKYLQPFAAEDPFNAGNVLVGALSRKPDSLYGGMAVLAVNGRMCPQKIFATPKLHYPFGKDGKFHFPPVKELYFYEKLDGTNVLSYAYQDENNQSFWSYKLRLSPFLRNGKWGDFLDMWKGLLEKYPEVPSLVRSTGYNLSFEMYGSSNEHLVRYGNTLDLSLLFGVQRETGALAAPHDMETAGIPSPRLIGTLDSSGDPVAKFADLRLEMERGNCRLPDGKISGTEGAVCYVRDHSGRMSLWKCKPESVEEIHWASGISKQAVLATCWNLLESADSLTYTALEPLLLEEYRPDEILAFRPHIERCVEQVNAEQEFRGRVREAYSELLSSGMDIEKDKSGVMRALSRKFPKEKMTKVYTAICR